jgi:hypothetical protein
MSAQANDDVESYQKAVSNENSPQCKDISDAMVRMPSPLPEQKSEQVIESKPQSGEYEEPRKVRKWVERIETNRDRIVLSVDPDANAEKIAKDRDETLMEHGSQFLLGF